MSYNNEGSMINGWRSNSDPNRYQPYKYEPEPYKRDNWSKGSLIANAGLAAFGAYNGYQSNKRLEKERVFSEKLANRNVQSLALTTNANLAARAKMQAQLAGGFDYGTNEMIQLTDSLYKPVNGAPIGQAAPEQMSLRGEILNLPPGQPQPQPLLNSVPGGMQSLATPPQQVV